MYAGRLKHQMTISDIFFLIYSQKIKPDVLFKLFIVSRSKCKLSTLEPLLFAYKKLGFD